MNTATTLGTLAGGGTAATLGTVSVGITILLAVLTGLVVLFRVRPESQASLLAGQQTELRRLMDDRDKIQERMQARIDSLEARLGRCEDEAGDLRARLRLSEEALLNELALSRAALADSQSTQGEVPPSPPGSTTASG